MQALNLEKVKTVKRCVKAMFAVMKSGFFRYSRTFTSKVVYGDTKYGSNTGHLTSDVWYQASDIRRLISAESWHKTYDIRHLKLDVWHQTFEIRGMKTDVWQQTSEIRRLMSDVWNQTADIRRLISVSWHQMSDIRHLKSDVWQPTYESDI